MKKHILVVDDDRAIRDSLKRYLTDHDFRAQCAPDGDAMNRLLAEHTFDLVILDLMLSGEDGLTLARQIRDGSDLPIIMLTRKGDEIDRIVGLEMGPTITCQSPTTRASCSRASNPCSGARTKHGLRHRPMPLPERSRTSRAGNSIWRRGDCRRPKATPST